MILARYAPLAVAIEAIRGGPGSMEAMRLADIDEGLSRLPEKYYAVVELRGSEATHQR
jgi:hypothetical protein